MFCIFILSLVLAKSGLPKASGLFAGALPRGLLFFRFRLILAPEVVIRKEALPL